MERKAERRRAFGPRMEQRRAGEVLIRIGSRPDRRDRHDMREVERRDRRLADICVWVAGKRPQPGFERVQPFGDAGEIAAARDLLDRLELEICTARTDRKSVGEGESVSVRVELGGGGVLKK